MLELTSGSSLQWIARTTLAAQVIVIIEPVHKLCINVPADR